MKIISKILVIKIQKTRQKLRYILALICLSAAVICSVSCVHTSKDPLEYRTFPFTAEVSMCYYGSSFDAVFSFFAPYNNGIRDFSVRFVSPESLTGLSVSSLGKELRILLGDTEYITLPADTLSGLRLRYAADMLSPTAPIRSILSIRGAECGLPELTSLTAVTVGDTVIYIDPGTSLPVKIDNIKTGEYLIIKSISIEKPQ